VPIVKALVAVAVTVTEAPRLTEEPLIVIALLVSDALAMFDNVFAEPEIETPFSVVSVPPRESESLPMVTELFDKLPLPILVNVLLAPLIVLPVSVCVPVSVTTVESIVIVTAAEPL